MQTQTTVTYPLSSKEILEKKKEILYLLSNLRDFKDRGLCEVHFQFLCKNKFTEKVNLFNVSQHLFPFSLINEVSILIDHSIEEYKRQLDELDYMML